jgi:hypothetical protein
VRSIDALSIDVLSIDVRGIDVLSRQSIYIAMPQNISEWLHQDDDTMLVFHQDARVRVTKNKGEVHPCFDMMLVVYCNACCVHHNTIRSFAHSLPCLLLINHPFSSQLTPTSNNGQPAKSKSAPTSSTYTTASAGAVVLSPTCAAVTTTNPAPSATTTTTAESIIGIGRLETLRGS